MSNILTFDDRAFLVGEGGNFREIVEQFEEECRRQDITPEQIANNLDWVIYNLAPRRINERTEIAPGISIRISEDYVDERGHKCSSCISEGVNVSGHTSYWIEGLPSGNKVQAGDKNSTLVGSILPHYIRAHHFPEGEVRYGLKTEFLVELVRRVKVPTFIDMMRGKSETGEVVLMDGGIGSNVMEGMPLGRLHQMFYDNGSSVSNTHTFMKHPIAMEREDSNPRSCKRDNYEAVMVARMVNGDNYIRGSMGPLYELLEPLGPIKEERFRAAYEQQIDALARLGGVDCLSIESTFDPTASRILADMAMKTGIPVIVSFFLEKIDYGDYQGELACTFGPFDKYFEQFRDVPILGINCCSLEDGLLFLELYRDRTDQFLMVEPNAGKPVYNVDTGLSQHVVTPQQFADYAMQYREAGANLIGGCCGSKPEHILAAAQAFDLK